MLTNDEKTKVVEDFENVLKENELKPGLIYILQDTPDSLKGISGLTLTVQTLPNAMYPSLVADMLNEEGKIAGRIGFTRTDYFPSELGTEEPESFELNMMYDLSFLGKFKESLGLKINAEAYINERNKLQAIINDLNKLIEENKLEG